MRSGNPYEKVSWANDDNELTACANMAAWNRAVVGSMIMYLRVSSQTSTDVDSYGDTASDTDHGKRQIPFAQVGMFERECPSNTCRRLQNCFVNTFIQKSILKCVCM